MNQEHGTLALARREMRETKLKLECKSVISVKLMKERILNDATPTISECEA